MYKSERLQIATINELSRLNSKRLTFNLLNEDFSKYYRKSNFFGRYLLRRQVRLLTYNSQYIGYLWYSKIGTKKGVYCINALYVDKEYIDKEVYKLFCDFNGGSIVYFDCKMTETSSSLLESIGFIRKNGTYELTKTINMKENIENSGLKFITFRRGRHEKLRCDIQNEIFRNSQREPLSVQDIYLDEMQEYYVNDWCIFLQSEGKIVGYGQIIMSNYKPLIVNFGVKDGYRHRGFGDILLCYLINILFDAGHKEVRIKVSTTNLPAYNLYRKKGFNVVDEYYTWIRTF
ncbi:MAG: GNAT family N-acetyltransferase [Bacillota bacterium]|nr:GNAT family N-acetyltransferase [Bacillota bacterium]